jgi:predicted transcriptional regulator
MVIELPPEVEARLEEVARHEGKAVSALLLDAAMWRYHDDLRCQERVQQSIAEANSGLFIEEEEMDSGWIKLLARPAPQISPER